MNRSESVTKIGPVLVKVQKTMETAKKVSENPFFRSNYADLNAIREVALPLLNENGVVVLQAMNGSTLETILMHESGEFISSTIDVVAAKQNDPQAYGSAITYARRYALQALLCIGAEDDDGEKAMARNTSARRTTTKQGGAGPSASAKSGIATSRPGSNEEF